MSVYVILNHELTADQREELTERFGEVEELTSQHRNLWGQVPAEGDCFDVQRHIWPILAKVKDHDVVVCQGEFTAFCEIFTFCQTTKRDVYVACSKRETVETTGEDGSITKKAVFKHVQFRRVPRY